MMSSNMAEERGSDISQEKIPARSNNGADRKPFDILIRTGGCDNINVPRVDDSNCGLGHPCAWQHLIIRERADMGIVVQEWIVLAQTG